MLIRRYNTYFACLDVPKDVRDIIGKTRFTRSCETEDRSKAEILHLRYKSEWLDQIRIARLRIPEFITKANILAKQDIQPTSEDIKIIADNLGDDAASKFVSIATKQDIILSINTQDYVSQLDQVKTSKDQISRDLEFILQRFDKFSDVNSKNIRKWIKDTRLDKTDNAIARVLRTFRKFIDYICYKFDVECQADFSMPKFEKVKSMSVDRSIIEPEQALKLYQSADDRLKNFILIAAYSGMRQSEIGKLKVKNIIIDKQVRCIDINGDVKTDTSVRRVPVHTMLVSVFDELCRGKGEDDYLFSLPRKTSRPTQVITNNFSDLKTKLGFGEDITFHGFRHSVETQLLRQGVDPKAVDQVLGHKTKGNSEGIKTYWGGHELVTLKGVVDRITWPKLATDHTLQFDDE